MNTKVLLVFLFYGIISSILAWIGFMQKKDLGAAIGYIIGSIISVILWNKYGKKYAM